jgi:putative addiction module component (TIGR02574 family)
MSDLLAELSHKARALSPNERELLVQEVLQSLVETADPEVAAAWDQEIRQRVDQLERGSAKLIPAADVFAEARHLLAR